MYLNSPYFYDDTIDTTSDNSLGDEPIDLYEIIRQRYERGSTISTSNRAIEERSGHRCLVTYCLRAPRSTGCFITLT